MLRGYRSHRLIYPLASLTRYYRFPRDGESSSTEAPGSVLAPRALVRFASERAARVGIQIQLRGRGGERPEGGSRKGMTGLRGEGEPAVDGFPSRLENTIDPPVVAFAHPLFHRRRRRHPSLSLFVVVPPLFLYVSFRILIRRSTFLSRLETNDEETRKNARLLERRKR